MQKIVLPNGLRVLYEHKKTNSVVVQVMVNVGSNDEAPEERGIAHFLEHILFEGTKKRPTNELISNEIEKIGGDFNAYTTAEKTCFYVKVLKKHFKLGVDILADIIQNSQFKKEFVMKERNIVLKEIDMINDEPRFYQWLLLQKHLFEKHPSKYPTYGTKQVIRNLNRDKVITFFNKHYVPNNMVVSIVGNIPNWKQEIKKKFIFQPEKISKRKRVREPKQKRNKLRKEKRDVANTYLVMGFKTVPRNHKDAAVLEVINGILGRGQSGRMFIEIRSKRGLAYDVGTQHVADRSFGYFAVYATIDKKNIKLVDRLITEEINKLYNVTENDLKEAKMFMEGNFLLSIEDTQKLADELLNWEQLGDANQMNAFLKLVKKVTVKDVQRVLKTYFKHHTTTILEGK